MNAPQSTTATGSVMASKSRLVSVVRFIAPLLILGAGIGALKTFGGREKPARNPDDSQQAALVRTSVVERFDDTFNLEVDGEAVSYRLITVGAEVAGRVAEKPDGLRGGSVVGKGDLLFQLDDAEYRLTAERLRAQLAKAEEDLAAVDVDKANVVALQTLAAEKWELEKKALGRVRQLLERRAGSETDLDLARRDELAARNSLETLKNETRALEQKQKTLQAARDLAAAQLREAELSVERAQITAPVTASVVGTTAEIGDYVRPGDRLLMLSDSRKMEVKCSLQIDELLWILAAGRWGTGGHSLHMRHGKNRSRNSRSACSFRRHLRKSCLNSRGTRSSGTEC